MLPALNIGGIERGVVDLSRELVRHGWDSIVLSAGGELARRIDDDGGRHIIFDCAAKNPFNAPIRAWRLRRLLQQLEPDIIHIRRPRTGLVIALCRCTLFHRIHLSRFIQSRAIQFTNGRRR